MSSCWWLLVVWLFCGINISIYVHVIVHVHAYVFWICSCLYNMWIGPGRLTLLQKIRMIVMYSSKFGLWKPQPRAESASFEVAVEVAVHRRQGFAVVLWHVPQEQRCIWADNLQGRDSPNFSCTLRYANIAIEDGLFIVDLPTHKWWFSRTILVYQRVSICIHWSWSWPLATFECPATFPTPRWSGATSYDDVNDRINSNCLRFIIFQ